MSVIITELSNSFIITKGWTHWTGRLTNIWLTQTHRGGTHWTERLTNKNTKGGTHRTERLTNIWLPQRVTGGDAPDGKTNHFLANTDTQGGRTGRKD